MWIVKCYFILAREEVSFMSITTSFLIIESMKETVIIYFFLSASDSDHSRIFPSVMSSMLLSTEM